MTGGNSSWLDAGMGHPIGYYRALPKIVEPLLTDNPQDLAGTLIREARRRADISQHELARRAHTSQATLSAYESGNKQPSIPTVVRILEAAGFEPQIKLHPRRHSGRDPTVF
jgi:DNA-binding XRE family transcriptional regulator